MTFINDGVKSFYFAGIGGVNMSSLALCLHNGGAAVRGSDSNLSSQVEKLRQAGIEVKLGHNAENIDASIDFFIYNAAIKPNNPEFMAAKALGLNMVDRGKLLGMIMQGFARPICIAGSHGKTTVTSMLSEIFIQAKKEPTIMNGAHLDSIGGSFYQGGDEFLIVEACEYCNSFLDFKPKVGIILNIDMDHTDFFEDLAALEASFASFAALIPPDGRLVLNANIQRVMKGANAITFGQGGDFYADDIRFIGGGAAFTACYRGRSLGAITLGVSGAHNVDNALAAIAAAYSEGIDFESIAAALAAFKGAARRFQYMGQFNNAAVIDDYAHHPTEVAAAISQARLQAQGRVIAVFQPHTQSRTASFMEEFAMSLSKADEVHLLPIYAPAGREESMDITSKDLQARINALSQHAVTHDGFDPLITYLKAELKPKDIALIMGAGDINKIIPKLFNV